MRVRNGTNVEYRPSPGVSYATHVSCLLLMCHPNTCKKQNKHWVLIRPWGQFCCPYVVTMRTTNCPNVECWPSHGVSFVTHVSVQCVRKIINILNIDLPWDQFGYPYVVPICVKNNTHVEYWSANWVSFVTRMSPQCVRKAIQMLNIYPPMGSVVLSICRSSVCKKQYERWI